MNNQVLVPTEPSELADSELSHWPWSWRISLTLCLELLDLLYMPVFFCMFVCLSLLVNYPILFKVRVMMFHSRCFGTVGKNQGPSSLRHLRDNPKAKMVPSGLRFFFTFLKKLLLPVCVPTMDQDLVPFWKMSELLDNLEL